MKNRMRKIVLAAMILCMILTNGITMGAAAAETPADIEAPPGGSGATATWEPAEEAPAGIVISDITISEPRPILYFEITRAQKSAGLPELIYDEKLEEAAILYAQALVDAGIEFLKSTDYLTLPSGEKVSTLLAAVDYPGVTENFYYYVWRTNDTDYITHLDYVKSTPLFQNAVVQGDYEKIGVAFQSSTGVNPFAVSVVMVEGYSSSLAVPEASSGKKLITD